MTRTELRAPSRRGLWVALCWLAACSGPADDEAAARRPEADGAPPRFTAVTQEMGLGGFRHETGATGRKWFPETMGSGAALADFDGDGWLDVFLAGGGRWTAESGEPAPALRLYRNTGPGGYVEHTEAAGLGGVEAYSFGVWTADVDDDGDPDVFVTTLGRDLLFRNDGGTFREIGEAAGVGGARRWTTAAAFFDADGDGRLDLYVGGYVDWSPERDLWCSLDGRQKSYCTPELYRGAGGRFYRNLGGGTFADETESRGFGGDRGKTLGAVTLDYDGDGWTDLFVANDTAADLLYHNDGGTFTEVGVAAGVAFDENGRPRGSMGVDAGVFDSDGLQSLVVGNFSKEMIGVYRYRGDGTFADRAARSRIGMASLLTLAFGLCIADFDLDGDSDVFAANGHVQDDVSRAVDGVDYRQPAQLFLNDGAGTFRQAPAAPGEALATRMVARGAAYGDSDRDGDVDLLLTENGGPVHLWRNRAAKGSAWLRLRLTGAAGREAIGHRVIVEAGGRRMEREVRGGGSYLSTSERTLTFGLGSAQKTERVRVVGPRGAELELLGLPANREVVLPVGDGGR